mmetsp:Transcript_79229/g.175708  ORF Transcript_79229/g.175708 Transcript_79229/m.175708 type:complete len:803 (+) Transcript_79229:92-2500(+)
MFAPIELSPRVTPVAVRNGPRPDNDSLEQRVAELVCEEVKNVLSEHRRGVDAILAQRLARQEESIRLITAQNRGVEQALGTLLDHRGANADFEDRPVMYGGSPGMAMPESWLHDGPWLQADRSSVASNDLADGAPTPTRQDHGISNGGVHTSTSADASHKRADDEQKPNGEFHREASPEEGADRRPAPTWVSNDAPLGHQGLAGAWKVFQKRQMTGQLDDQTTVRSESAQRDSTIKLPSSSAEADQKNGELEDTRASSESAETAATAAEERLTVLHKAKRTLNSFHIMKTISSLSFSSSLKDSEENFGALRSRAKQLVKRTEFDVFSCVLVMTNVVVMGAEVDQVMTYGSPGETLDAMQHALNVWFLLELLLRLFVERARFFISPEWRYNWLDMFLVSTSIVDLCVSAIQGGVGSSSRNAMRIVRLLRIMRVLRVGRALRYVREFRKMIYSIQASMQTLIWSLVLLGLILYGFSILLSQSIGETLYMHKDDGAAEPAQIKEIRSHFGSLGVTVISLFKAITNGISWGTLLTALLDVEPAMGLCFLVYVSVSLIGIMNVVTAVFVESAMTSAQYYKDLIIQDRMQAKEIAVMHMQHVFHQIDQDGTGEIDIDEMELFLKDPELRMYVESLDISADDARMLFRLMDYDDGGTIDIDEFCQGLMRLKGEAKSFDVHSIIFNNNKFMVQWDDFVAKVDTSFRHVIQFMKETQYQLHSVHRRLGVQDLPLPSVDPGLIGPLMGPGDGRAASRTGRRRRLSKDGVRLSKDGVARPNPGHGQLAAELVPCRGDISIRTAERLTSTITKI